MTSRIEQRLGEESVSALGGTLGSDFSQLLSSWIWVNGDFVSSSQFTAKIGERRWLVLKNKWFETKADFLDCYQLTCSTQAAPDDFTVGRTKSQHIHLPASSVLVAPGLATSPVASIDVLERKREGESEVVLCDHSLVFNLENGHRFVIAAGYEVHEWLTFSQTDDGRKELLGDSKLRLTIK